MEVPPIPGLRVQMFNRSKLSTRRLSNVNIQKPISSLLAGCSKRSRGEAREDRFVGEGRDLPLHYSTLTRNRSSATKHMGLFQQPAKQPFVPCQTSRPSH